MKKLLALLSSVGIVLSSGTTVVSCGGGIPFNSNTNGGGSDSGGGNNDNGDNSGSDSGNDANCSIELSRTSVSTKPNDYVLVRVINYKSLTNLKLDGYDNQKWNVIDNMSKDGTFAFRYNDNSIKSSNNFNFKITAKESTDPAKLKVCVDPNKSNSGTDKNKGNWKLDEVFANNYISGIELSGKDFIEDVPTHFYDHIFFELMFNNGIVKDQTQDGIVANYQELDDSITKNFGGSKPKESVTDFALNHYQTDKEDYGYVVPKTHDTELKGFLNFKFTKDDVVNGWLPSKVTIYYDINLKWS